MSLIVTLLMGCPQGELAFEENHKIGTPSGSRPLKAATPDSPDATDAPDFAPQKLIQLAPGVNFSCALTAKHEVLCWSAPHAGYPHYDKPSQYQKKYQLIAASPSGHFNADTFCGVLSNNGVECWMIAAGDSDKSHPTGIGSGAVAQIAGGNQALCVLTKAGDVECISGTKAATQTCLKMGVFPAGFIDQFTVAMWGGAFLSAGGLGYWSVPYDQLKSGYAGRDLDPSAVFDGPIVVRTVGGLLFSTGGSVRNEVLCGTHHQKLACYDLPDMWVKNIDSRPDNVKDYAEIVASQVAVSEKFSCATIPPSGKVTCWPNEKSGASAFPVMSLPLLPEAALQISAKYSNLCVILAKDNRVKCYEMNFPSTNGVPAAYHSRDKPLTKG